MTTARLRLGSRASPLAMAQSRFVQGLLAHASGAAREDFPIDGMTTTGDRIQDRRLQDAGGKGLFTKELDEALLAGRIDAAVHSMKDLPTAFPEGLALVCVPSREDPRDAFISRIADSLDSLPEGAVVGTASLRRQAQTLHRRPDLKVVTLRGSVETRLRRIAEGEIAATYLALAGLTRLGLTQHITAMVPMDMMPPAAGQGALAIVTRAGDTNAQRLLAPLSLVDHEIATVAERAFLEALDGSCRTPIAAYGRIEGGRLNFMGEVLTPDGRRRWRREASITLASDPAAEAHALGRGLGQEIRAEAGPDLVVDVGGWVQ